MTYTVIKEGEKETSIKGRQIQSESEVRSRGQTQAFYSRQQPCPGTRIPLLVPGGNGLAKQEQQP